METTERNSSGNNPLCRQPTVVRFFQLLLYGHASGIRDKELVFAKSFVDFSIPGEIRRSILSPWEKLGWREWSKGILFCSCERGLNIMQHTVFGEEIIGMRLGKCYFSGCSFASEDTKFMWCIYYKHKDACIIVRSLSSSEWFRSQDVLLYFEKLPQMLQK